MNTDELEIKLSDDIPDPFLLDSSLTIFWKYYPKISVGKNKLPFPVNFLFLLNNSSYFKTLFNSTDISPSSVSKITFLSEYPIVYSSKPFLALWFAMNTLYTIDISPFSPEELLELKLYCEYFGYDKEKEEENLDIEGKVIKILNETKVENKDTLEQLISIWKSRLTKEINSIRKVKSKRIYERIFDNYSKLDLPEHKNPNGLEVVAKDFFLYDITDTTGRTPLYRTLHDFLKDMYADYIHFERHPLYYSEAIKEWKEKSLRNELTYNVNYYRDDYEDYVSHNPE